MPAPRLYLATTPHLNANAHRKSILDGRPDLFRMARCGVRRDASNGNCGAMDKKKRNRGSGDAGQGANVGRRRRYIAFWVRDLLLDSRDELTERGPRSLFNRKRAWH